MGLQGNPFCQEEAHAAKIFTLSPLRLLRARARTHTRTHTHTLRLVPAGVLRTILHTFVTPNSTAKCLSESLEENANMETLSGFNSDVPNLCPGQETTGNGAWGPKV